MGGEPDLSRVRNESGLGVSTAAVTSGPFRQLASRPGPASPNRSRPKARNRALRFEVLPMAAVPMSQIDHEARLSADAGVGAAAAELLRALRGGGERVNRLLAEAEVLEQRARALAEGERALADREAKASEQRKKLDERQELQWSRLREEAAQLSARESQYMSRWRWLQRSWRQRPLRPAKGARVCDLLFVPTSEGYKLLAQDGLALVPGATLTGLLGEERCFVVAKIALWPFDGRWCAYLQQEATSWQEEGL